MAREITEQYVTFWFVLDERATGDETVFDDLHPVWKRANELVEEGSKAHPLRVYEVQEGGHSYEVERWELCEPEPYLEDRGGKTAWPVAFYHTKAFEPQVLQALKALCATAMADAAGEVPVRFVEATAYTVYRETETTVIEGL